MYRETDEKVQGHQTPPILYFFLNKQCTHHFKKKKSNNLFKEQNDLNTVHYSLESKNRDFPGGAVVKNPPANAGDMGSSPGPGRSHMPRSN